MAQAETENIIDNNSERFDRRLLLWAITLFIVFILTIGAMSLFIMAEQDLYYPFRLISTMHLIKALYPDEFNGDSIMKQAREAVFSQLDRYSGYVEPEELARVTEEFTGSYGGIGITIIGHDRGLAVMSVREGGPADRVGIRTGDIIIRIDDLTIAGLNESRTGYLLRGEEGTEVKVAVARNEFSDTLQFDLKRENLKLIHIPYAGLTENNSLYIRILDFEAGLLEQLNDILDSSYENHKADISALILDVRGNPGGLLHEAVAVCDLFLDKGHLIVGVKGRSRWNSREYFSSGNDFFEGLPLAILIDGSSASAAEILAGALKFSGRATLIGDTTYGKGLVQEYDYLNDGSGIRLTTARYYFESNVYLNDPEVDDIDSSIGIAPDYYIKSIESELFPRELASSQLLRTFAVKHQEEILALAPFAQPPPKWFNTFINYAASEGFEFESDLTSVAKFVRDEVVYRNHSDAAFKTIDIICRLAEDDDQRQFEKYQDYIKQRLYQLATESTFGRARAYRVAIVPYRPEIFLAEQVLSGEVSD